MCPRAAEADSGPVDLRCQGLKGRGSVEKVTLLVLEVVSFNRAELSLIHPSFGPKTTPQSNLQENL